MSPLPSINLMGFAEAEAPVYLYYMTLVLTLGVGAQWLAAKTGLPSILLLLMIGILTGQFMNPDKVIADVTEGGDQAGTRLLFPLVSLSVAVIMFEGGLSLRVAELREAGAAVLRLVTLGALVTFVLAAIAAHLTLGIAWRPSLLIGAILVVTGPTVVLPLLRQIRPSRRVEAILKWEGIVIDPIGAVLAVLVFEEFLRAQRGFDPLSATALILKTSGVGIAIGFLGSRVLIRSFQNYWVPDFLQGVFALAVALGLFTISNAFSAESGLITVTIMGVLLANQNRVALTHVIELKEHLRTLLLGCLFIVLGSRIKPAELLSLGWGGVFFVASLVLLVRPASVWLSMLGTGLGWREKVFLSAMAPRGIVAASVASIFALKIEGQEDAAQGETVQFVPIVFLSILATVIIYGLVAGPLARRMGLAQSNPQGLLIAGADRWVRALASVLHANKVPILLVDTNLSKISEARDVGLPAANFNILSDHAVAEINLGGLGRLLALTPNDEVNSLAVQEFRHLFSRAGVFQLSFSDSDSADPSELANPSPIAAHLQGRILFGREWTFSKIRELYEDGAHFQAIRVTPAMKIADAQQFLGANGVVMFVIDGPRVLIHSIDSRLQFKTGDTLIALVPPSRLMEEKTDPRHPLSGVSEDSFQGGMI